MKKQQLHMQILILGMISFLFFSPLVTVASMISVEAPAQASVGERISVDVFVDPQQISINSIQTTVLFSSEILSFNGFSAKQSSIPVWVEEPKEKISGAVSFSGVIPGGLERLYDPLHANNRAIPVVRLFFITKKAGTTSLSFGVSSVLANDGKGTKTVVSTIPTSISVVPAANNAVSILSTDAVPPNPFGITIISQSLFGKTPRLAVFGADDPEGGIDHYEVRVGDLGFVRATSPFALPYRLFSYPFTVRAFDYSGNMREQTIAVPAESSTLVDIPLGIICIILIGFFGYRFYNRRKV